MKFKYLPGLNTLRFFAAFFVVICHANQSLDKLKIYQFKQWAFLNRGGEAVEFFFTLSGFLITYLLINEATNTGTVSIRKFYLRRVFRIWPLYFIVVAMGFFLLGYIYPKLYHQSFFSFPIWHGLLLFIFFLPNYAAKNYLVGLLNPLWSIGVEEQFYLFWAPLAKLFRKKILSMIIIFLVLSTCFYIIVSNDLFFITSNWKSFFLSQKFYAMATGSLFAYILFYQYERYNNSFFTNKIFQAFVLLAISWYYLIGFSFSDSLAFKIFVPYLYGLLILNIATIENKLVNLEIPFFTYLGTISYGIYMYHMLVDYTMRLIAQKAILMHIPKSILIPFYYISLLSCTIGLARLSYKYIESFFLRLKDRMHSVQ